jgi:hypothetical protein
VVARFAHRVGKQRGDRKGRPYKVGAYPQLLPSPMLRSLQGWLKGATSRCFRLIVRSHASGQARTRNTPCLGIPFLTARAGNSPDSADPISRAR